MRLLLVDDDDGLRELVRTTLEGFAVEVREAASADEAARFVHEYRPDLIVLDVMMPGTNGLDFCRALKSDERTSDVRVVLLTGSNGASSAAALDCGADAYVTKPFSPLELLTVVEQLAGSAFGIPFRRPKVAGESEEQLLLYARDLRHMLELERTQRQLVQKAYRETVCALASALESKDTGTRQHSQRVQRYAIELAKAVDDRLAGDTSAEYGFLLHDVGKIGIPDRILLKPAPLTEPELRLMRSHTVVGEQMLGDVAFLQGQGVRIVRSHHERWDGDGYPDGLAGEDIPLGARVFALADALDAMTSDRPYRRARPWGEARQEIVREAGKQFDPNVVEAFRDCERDLREIRLELDAA